MTQELVHRRDGVGPARIEDYALVGDTHTAALVARDGSVDWLCLPRFDSGACFAGLLGTTEHGRFALSPVASCRRIDRRYRGQTLILETDFETHEGSVRVVDFMPIRSTSPVLVRIVEGRSGRVPMQMELVIRFDYGSIVPWVHREQEAVIAVGGPDGLCLRTPVPTRGRDMRTVAEFEIAEGDRVPFTLTWFPSNEGLPPPLDWERAERETQSWWSEWSDRCAYEGDWKDEILRSLITLKALTHEPTGGIVAAPTTSLPEQLGGTRNWDYRFCWLRDATSTIEALMAGGYEEEARGWRDWLLRAVAGDPSRAQIMYGLGGERRIPETELPWLPGYDGAAPVRIGNAAATQFQLDVYGEVLDAMLQSGRAGFGTRGSRHSWSLLKLLVEFVESNWKRPDAGIWEIRGPERPFTHSKVMAWVALDRAICAVEEFDVPGPIDRWRAVRDEIRDDVLSNHVDVRSGAFVQYAGSSEPDASLLLIPIVGFLPPDDPRVAATVEWIEKELTQDGFVNRYESDRELEHLPEGEGVFVACTLWLANALQLLGRAEDARATFERVLGLANDVGLLSEEYDPASGRLTGNFPQAFSHQWLVLVARNLSQRPARGRHAGTAAGGSGV